MKLFARVLLLICLLAAGTLYTAIAQDSQPITDLDAELLSQSVESPANVTLDVRVTSAGRTVPDLQEDAFSLLGDTTNDLTVTAAIDTNLDLIFIIDVTSENDIPDIQSVLSAYFGDDNNYQESDNVTFIVMNGDVDYLTPPTTTLDEIETAIEGLEESEGFSRPAEVLPSVLAQAQRAENPVQVVYVASLIFNPAGLDVQLDEFEEANIPIHAIQAHRGRLTDAFEDLAAQTNGLFVNNDRQQHISRIGSDVVARGDLADLFETLNQSRLYYKVSYLSTATGTDPREVTLVITPEEGDAAQIAFEYEPSYDAPRVEIVSPTNLSPQRRFNDDGDLDNVETTVYVRVVFPDGVRRDLESVRLDVLDSDDDPVQSPIELENPELREGEPLLLEWSLASFDREGLSTAVTLEVTVVDAFGLTASVTRDGEVTVEQRPTPSVVEEVRTASVSIVEPRPLAPVRSFLPGNTDLNNPSVDVVLDLTLPETDTGEPDEIESVELLVTDPATGGPKQSRSYTPDELTQVTGGSVIVPWNLMEYNIADSVTNINVEIVVNTVGGVTITTRPQPASVTIGPMGTPLPAICAVLSVGIENCQNVEVAWQLGQLALIIALGTGFVFLATTRQGRDYVRQRVTGIYQMTSTAIERATSILTGTQPPGPMGSRSRTMGTLEVLEGADLIKENQIIVDKAIFTLGRHLADGVDHVLDLQGISRRHCTVHQVGDGQFTLEDHESSNGTYINGKRIMPHQRYPLNAGDRIRMNKITLAWHPGRQGAQGYRTPFQQAANYQNPPAEPYGGIKTPQPYPTGPVPRPPIMSGIDTEIQFHSPSATPARNPIGRATPIDVNLSGADEYVEMNTETSGRRLPARGLRVDDPDENPPVPYNPNGEPNRMDDDRFGEPPIETEL
jgi:hypothetical protein